MSSQPLLYRLPVNMRNLVFIYDRNGWRQYSHGFKMPIAVQDCSEARMLLMTDKEAPASFR